MRHNISYTTGELINGIKFIREDGYIQYKIQKGRAAIFVCPVCNIEFRSDIAPIKSGATKSCGCVRYKTNRISHGMSKTSEYLIWHDMKQRCYNKKSEAYKSYGAKGIKMCKKWRNSFESFYKDMGNRPSSKHSVDRIDNYKGYYPDNCRWATYKEQCRNKRRTIFLTHKNITKTLAEWIEETGVETLKTRQRLRLGWSIERAFEGKI